MILYAKVMQTECIACGLCQMLAPSLFTYDETGIASFVPDHNTGQKPLSPEETIDFKIAYRRCPTHAIKRAGQPFDLADH